MLRRELERQAAGPRHGNAERREPGRYLIDGGIQLEPELRHDRPREVGERAFQPHLPRGEHDHAVADRLHIREHVRRQQDRLAVVVRECCQPAEHRPPFDRIEAVGRLVEDHQPWVVHDRRGEGHLLPHAHRERLHGPISFLTRVAPVEHFVGAAERLRGGQPAEPGRVAHRFHRRQPRHRAFVLRHHADEPPHHVRFAGGIVALHQHPPGREPHQPEDRADQRALAGAVGADEPGDPGEHLAGDVVEHRAVAVPLHNAVKADGHGGGRHASRPCGPAWSGVEPGREGA